MKKLKKEKLEKKDIKKRVPLDYLNRHEEFRFIKLVPKRKSKKEAKKEMGAIWFIKYVCKGFLLIIFGLLVALLFGSLIGKKGMPAGITITAVVFILEVVLFYVIKAVVKKRKEKKNE